MNKMHIISGSRRGGKKFVITLLKWMGFAYNCFLWFVTTISLLIWLWHVYNRRKHQIRTPINGIFIKYSNMCGIIIVIVIICSVRTDFRWTYCICSSVWKVCCASSQWGECGRFKYNYNRILLDCWNRDGLVSERELMSWACCLSWMNTSRWLVCWRLVVRKWFGWRNRQFGLLANVFIISRLSLLLFLFWNAVFTQRNRLISHHILVLLNFELCTRQVTI